MYTDCVTEKAENHRNHRNLGLSATVTVVFREGTRTAIMYATRKILAGEEIMWNYGIGQDSPNSTPTKLMTTGEMGCSDIADDIVPPETRSRGSLPVSIAMPELVDMLSDKKIG